MWYRGGDRRGRRPVVDTWWQTETGGIMISSAPGATTTKPGSATFPLPGISAGLRRRGRQRRDARWLPHLDPPVAGHAARHLGRSRALPGHLLSRFPGRYFFAGDGAKLDDDGYLWLLKRADDVMNVSGHRISTTEVESALVSHPAVAEAAVVGAPTRRPARRSSPTSHCAAAPRRASTTCARTLPGRSGDRQTEDRLSHPLDLPKTRSGKIMRRASGDIATGRNLGDTTTLADATVVDEIKRRAGEAPPEE